MRRRRWEFQIAELPAAPDAGILARMTTLADLMQPDPVAVAPEDTIGEAAQKMVDRGIGSAVVSDYGRLIGILTERDILRAVAARTHSSEARVREWMTAEPITAEPDASPSDAARVMLDNGFRHLPVVDGERAIGMVSIRDLVRWSVEQADADA
jgi:CBS domain-containing protein